jgi:uncharacterized protein
MLRWFENSLVYHPGRVMRSTGAELGRPFQDVFFKAGDGVELNGWFYPANGNSPRAGWALLYCHGNAGNISSRLGIYAAILETGVSLLSFDYRGYGRSRGKPSEEGTYRDTLAAFQWLRNNGFPGENIIAFGESLGGGIASELAVRAPLGGLVLQSTFTSVPELGIELYPWLPVRLLSTIQYDTIRRLPQLKIPVLIMHSPTDDLIPFHHGQRLFAAANEPKLFCELEGGHNDALGDGKMFIGGLEQFLSLLCSAERPGRARS